MKNLLYVCLFIIFNAVLYGRNNTVYIVPMGGLGNVEAFFFNPYVSRDEANVPFYKLRIALENMGYEVKYTEDAKNLDDVAGIISFQEVGIKLLKNLEQYNAEKLLFIFEPPVVMPGFYTNRSFEQYFTKIFIMHDNLVDNTKYYKFYYPQPRSRMIENVPAFGQKKFCVLINGNKDFYHPSALYAERRKAIHFFERNHANEFDLYGPDWHGYRSWKGGVPRKWEVLKNYKFCICYENMKDQTGGITEKIFDCFVGGCVPVYWGANNITDYVPANCFIDRRMFASYEELYSFLKKINQKQYNEYIENIRKYLASSQMYLFSSDYFIDTIVKALELRSYSI